MRAKTETVAESGLLFFGKMTGSISHEINNVLAIINENAGLLEDLALLLDRGAIVDSQRMKKISQAVMKQVRRADTIVKNMNRLAHSVDESIKTIDLNDMLELLAALSERFASTRGVAVQPQRNQDPLKLRTSPFFLMNLLWLCLDFAMGAAGEDKIVELAPGKTAGGIQVFFKGLGDLAGAPLKPLRAELDKGLTDLTKAKVEVDVENRLMVVTVAEDINAD